MPREQRQARRQDRWEREEQATDSRTIPLRDDAGQGREPAAKQKPYEILAPRCLTETGRRDANLHRQQTSHNAAAVANQSSSTTPATVTTRLGHRDSILATEYA